MGWGKEKSFGDNSDSTITLQKVREAKEKKKSQGVGQTDGLAERNMKDERARPPQQTSVQSIVRTLQSAISIRASC